LKATNLLVIFLIIIIRKVHNIMRGCSSMKIDLVDKESTHS